MESEISPPRLLSMRYVLFFFFLCHLTLPHLNENESVKKKSRAKFQFFLSHSCRLFGRFGDFFLFSTTPVNSSQQQYQPSTTPPS
jgi:hypothetical protein